VDGRAEAIGAGAYRALYEHCPDGVLFTNPDGAILAANPAACEILELTEAQICALGRVGLADPDDTRWSALVARRQRRGRVSGIARMRRGDGRLIEVEMSSLVFSETDGAPRTCTIIRDVSERVGMEQELRRVTDQLRRLSMNDALTRVYNRRGLLAFGQRLLELADRSAAPVQVLFADVEDMKGLNDELGHKCGDAGLQAVAQVLSEEFRRADVVARVGGDEFVVLSMGNADTDNVSRRIRAHLAGPETSDMVGRRIGVTRGWVTRPPGDTRSLDDLMAEADRVMYRSRARKRRVLGGDAGRGASEEEPG